MDGSLDDMVFTDPPYNVDYKGRKHGGIKNDNMSEEEFHDSGMFVALFLLSLIVFGFVWVIRSTPYCSELSEGKWLITVCRKD